MRHSQPFDDVARDYDATFTETQTGQLQRKQVYQHLRQILQQADIQTVLEINCGTGVDACWLAQQGKDVLATDISPGMIEVAETKRAKLSEDIRQRLQFQTLSATELDTTQSYDLILSNFGGLNCLSPTELEAFLKKTERMLKPDGRLVAVIMGRFCWWETLYFTLKGQFGKAFRRLRRKPTMARLDDHNAIATWYYSTGSVLQMVPFFKYAIVRPIGFFLPPSYLEPFFAKRPRLLAFLNRLEKHVENWDWPAWGADHYFVAMQKTSEGEFEPYKAHKDT